MKSALIVGAGAGLSASIARSTPARVSNSPTTVVIQVSSAKWRTARGMVRALKNASANGIPAVARVGTRR